MMTSSLPSPSQLASRSANAGARSERSRLSIHENVGIIAVDGGAICGLAVYTGKFASYEYPPQTTLTVLEQFLHLRRFKWIVRAVRYDLAGKQQRPMSTQVDAIEVNGEARWIASQCDATFALQSRSEAKRI